MDVTGIVPFNPSRFRREERMVRRSDESKRESKLRKKREARARSRLMENRMLDFFKHITQAPSLDTNTKLNTIF